MVDADVAWSYRRRFETRRGESPFEIRRARADAALARYGRSLDRVARVATRWLEEREDHLGALQRRHAVERLLRFLRERPPGFSGAWVELGVDLLEHALANVLAHPDRPIRSHPFR